MVSSTARRQVYSTLVFNLHLHQVLLICPFCLPYRFVLDRVMIVVPVRDNVMCERLMQVKEFAF